MAQKEFLPRIKSSMKGYFFSAIRLSCLACLVYCTSSFDLPAQALENCNFTIEGLVLDEHDATPLAYTTIFLPTLQKGTTTDETGKFYFPRVCPGSYPIRIEHLGSTTIVDTLHVPTDSVLLFYMEHHTEVLKEITVTSSKIATSFTQSAVALQGINLTRLRGQSLGATLENIAGVQTLKTGPTIAKPIIHGLHSDRILVLNNGVRQEGQQWGIEHAPEIDPFVADQLTVVKGAAAVQYGADAMGGVVLVQPAELPQQAGVKGTIYAVGISNGRQGIFSSKLEGALKALPQLAWRVNGTFRKAGDAKTPNYFLTNTATEEIHYSASAGYTTANKGVEVFHSRFHTNLGILRSAHIGNLTDLQIAISRAEPFVVEDFSYQIQAPRQLVTHQLWKASSYWNHTGLGKWQAIYAFQQNARQEFDIRRNSEDARPALDMNLQTHQVILKLDHPVWKSQSRGTIGLNYEYQKNRNVPGTGVRPLIPFYDSHQGGLFWIERWIGARLEAELGARYDVQQLVAKKFDQNNILVNYLSTFHSVAVNAGATWKFRPNWKWSSNLGTAFRAPNPAELFSEGLHHGAAAIEQGNPALQQEKAIKWVNTLHYAPSSNHQIEWTFYTQWIRDFIYLQLQEQPRLTIRGAFPVFDYVQSNAHLYGMDVQTRLAIHPTLFFMGKAALLRAKNLDTQTWLQYVPADRAELGFSFEPKTLGIWSDIQIQLTGSQVWRQKRSPSEVLQIQDFNATTPTFSTLEIPPPDGYFLMHLQVGGKLQLDKHDLFVQFSINNIWNTNYREYLNRLRYYADDVGRSLELRLQYSF